MSLVIGSLLLAALTGVGWWPSRRLAPASGGLARIALALALGAALVGLLQVLLSALGVRTTAAPVVLLAGVSLLAARLQQVDAPQANAPLGKGLGMLLAAVVIVGGVVAVGLPFKGDGGKFWGPRARSLSQYAAVDAPDLHDPDRLAFHRTYPLLAPTLLAPAFALSPQDAHAGAKLLLAGFTAALLVLATLRLASRGRHGRLLAVVLLCVPSLTALDLRESLVAGGYVDGLFALFLLLLVDAIDVLRRGEGGARETVLVALMAAALLATKREGVVVVAIVFTAWALVGPRRKGWLSAAFACALLSLPTVFLRFDVLADPLPFRAGHLSLDTLMARLPTVAIGLASVPLDVTALGLLPLGVLLVAFMRRGTPSPRAAPWPWGFAMTLTLGLGAFLVVVYCLTPMHAERHLDTSLHRLLAQWLPALALLVAGRPGEPERRAER